MKKKTWIFGAAIMLIAALGLSSCGSSGGEKDSADQKFVMRIGNVTAPDHILNITFEEMATAINERSGGRIEATVYPSGQLGTLRTMTEGLQNGTLEMTTQSPGGLASFMPMLGVLELPYMFENNQEVYNIVDGPIAQELDQQFLEKSGIRIISYWMNLVRETTNNKRPITNVNDFAGLKIRVPETKTIMEAFNGLGANPTPMAFGEVYTGLSQGTIDGQENPTTIIHASKLYEVQKYLSLTRHVYSPTVVMISEDFFQKLPEDLQQIVLEEAEAAKIRGRANSEKLDEENLELLRDLMEVNEFDSTGVEEFVQPAYKAVIKDAGSDAETYIERIREELKKSRS